MKNINVSDSAYVRLEQDGVCINGTYKILLASSLFYFRIPRERWEERMLLLKAAGYNAIDVYFPWNFHEILPGVWDFSGQRDVKCFLELAAKHKLFVIARPGPYICSEWDGGALPPWLWVEGVPVRQDHPDFLSRIGAWYSHILPVIAPFQITEGGTVICMQIENELDFFDCKSPVTYMEKLMGKALSSGITVPLFYCCGQNDLLRGGGLTKGLYTAFNVYAASDDPLLEERAMHLYHEVSERKMPFLVTETNREHSFLKRLFVCGAKLISPYNQTAGSTLEWYNGITNWGPPHAPLSLLTSDYDFQSMIGSAGEVNEQFYEARLFAGLIHSLGESLAKGIPGRAEDVGMSLSGTDDPVYVLHTSRGSFAAVSNTGNADSLELCHEDQIYPLTIPHLKTVLLPVDLQLSEKGDVILKDSCYEVAYIREENGTISVGMYGEGPFSARLKVKGEVVLIEGKTEDMPCRYPISNIVIIAGPAEYFALSHIPGLPDIHRSIKDQETDIPVLQGQIASCRLPKSRNIMQKVQPMEASGQYRGIGDYSFCLDGETRILFCNLADIFTIRRNGELFETGFSPGGCVERVLDSGRYQIQTEIWGHSNFDDIRCPSLRMGSLKGISCICQIRGKINLTENWLFDLDEQPLSEWYFFRHSGYQTISSIDSYNRASMPIRAVYDRWVDIPDEAESLFLHFAKADCIISVYVNGHWEGDVLPSDPYVDLSSYAGSGRIELCLRVMRRFYSDEVGKVSLLYGAKIAETSYQTVKDDDICVPEDMKEIGFPLRLPPCEDTVLRLAIPVSDEREMKLVFEAQDVKLTVFHKKRLIGRLLFAGSDFPVMKGGDPHVVHLCREWLEEEMPLIWCQPVGKKPCIQKVELKKFTSVLT